MSFNWRLVDKLAKERHQSVQAVVAEIGLGLERASARVESHDARLSCLERADRYNTRRVDELELTVIRHRYYLLLSCAFEACILLYLFSR